MATKPIPLEKIDEYRWRLPQSYRRGMRVPGIVYADERLLRQIAREEALEQVANVATLPGIVGASLAMPDIHWGYGFPVGGVAAFDVDEGVIAAGGVGYDINCLSGDTRVLHRFGYHRTLREVVEAKLEGPVLCYELEGWTSASGQIQAFMSRAPGRPVVEARTASGRSVIATTDHLFLTPSGMRPIGGLVPGDRLALDPFEGMPYEDPGDDVIFDRNAVVRFLTERGKTGGNTVAQVVRALEARRLLPLRLSSPMLPLLLKALGVVMGDGSIHFSRRTGKGVVAVFGRGEDLEDVRTDLGPLYRVSRVYARRRRHRIVTDYGERRFESESSTVKVSSTSFAVVLALLGAPVGNRSIQDYEVPEWLGSAPPWQKRLFLAAYFGAELQTPRSHVERGRNFPCPLLTVQKAAPFAASGRRFLEKIAAMSEEFGAETLGIEEREEKTVRRHGPSRRLRLVFSSRPRSLRSLYQRIGFEYNRKRRAEGAAASVYQSLKLEAWQEREDAIETIVELRAGAGLGAAAIAARQGHLPVNRRFISRTIYGGERRAVRTPQGFSTYSSFRVAALDGLGRSGLVWDTIREVRPRDDVDLVYDISVGHPYHNFVANGFVVHNCGTRIVRTDLTVDEVRPRIERLADELFRSVPSGVGAEGGVTVKGKEIDRVLRDGAAWAVERGFGWHEDLEVIEERGSFRAADPDMVSARAKERGSQQLGTLGSGNHFCEAEVVDEIFDPAIAAVFGIDQVGQVIVFFHCGSRGLGHQVCDDYLKVMAHASHKYSIELADRQLACAPFRSEEGRRYFSAMQAGANFAWANRECITHQIRDTFAHVFEKSARELGMRLVYDVAHNIAKVERHDVDGHSRDLVVHRKGATRSFPAGHADVSERYRRVGQPVLIPGDMGRYSFICVGSDGAMRETFGSTCHGAGRAQSRHAAMKTLRGVDIASALKERGITVRVVSKRLLAEEASEAYKDVADVVNVCDHAGISHKVARMRPLAVIKG